MHRRSIKGDTPGLIPTLVASGAKSSSSPAASKKSIIRSSGSSPRRIVSKKLQDALWNNIQDKSLAKALKILFVISACLFAASAAVRRFLGPVAFGSSPTPWTDLVRPASNTNTVSMRLESSPKLTYDIPDSVPDFGDKSDFYALLRQSYDEVHPPNAKRSRKVVGQSRKYQFDVKSPMDTQSDDKPYDIYNCPEIPPEGYPYAWNLLDILHHWPSDDPEPRQDIHLSLCVFDFEKDYDKALNYRNAELPFILQNDPQVAVSVERWSAPHYMESLLGEVEFETEYSESSQFVYWDRNKGHAAATREHQDWKKPTSDTHMTFSEWMEFAKDIEDHPAFDKPHYYFKLSGCGSRNHNCAETPSEFLFDELPFFQPKPNSVYFKEPNEAKGIYCRFGMKGVIAQNHFDGGRNFIAVLGGERRYILAHPNQCDKFALYPENHPSFRHSAVVRTNI